MNINIILNNKKHKINVHKYDSILSIKDLVYNKFLKKNSFYELDFYELEFFDSNDLNDIQVFYKQKLLKNNDSCSNLGIAENNHLHIYLKRKGGNLWKKIVFYLVCIFMIFLPVFILPTGLNTGGVTFIGLVMQKVKDSMCRYLKCELNYRTLTNRFSTIIDWIKLILIGLATYTLITVGTVTACCLSKGLGMFDNPNKVCSPYNVGATAGLILTVVYLMIYFSFRFSDKILIPFESWAKGNFVTNLLVRPLISLNIYMLQKFKFMFVYFLPYVGSGINGFHKAIDASFPGLIMVLQQVSEGGCSSKGINFLKNTLKNINKQVNSMKHKIQTGQTNNGQGMSMNGMPSMNGMFGNSGKEKGNGNNGNENNENNGVKGNNKNKTNNNFNLYDFDFQNGVIDNHKYEKALEELREERKKVNIKPEPICLLPAGGPCCQSEIFLVIADFLYKYLGDNQMIKNQLQETGMFLGINLALIGLYEKALYGDNYPLTFNKEDVIGNKILLKKFYDTFKDDIKKEDNKKNIKNAKLVNEIEELLYGPDEDFPEPQDDQNSKNNPNKLTKVKNSMLAFLKKDTIKDDEQILEINNKINGLEQDNIDYAQRKKEDYQAGNSPIKFFIKEVFITVLCNFLATANAGATIFDAIGGVNQFMDMLKSGAAAGGIIVFIYIIVVIILIICGFFGIY